MFTQPCFIRKNTSELREKLEGLGYNRHPSYNDNGQYLYLNRGFYHTNVVGYSEEIERMIDCKTNEELFLALAALRYDAQINQYYWFNSRLFKCEGLEIDRVLKNNTANYLLKCRCVDNPIVVSCFKERNARKATVEEIIEQFK